MTSELWRMRRLDEVALVKGGQQLPREDYAEAGEHLVYGSNTIMGRTHKFNTPGPFISFARVGSTCGAVMFSSEHGWVNNNASRITARDETSCRWLYYALQAADLEHLRAGSGQPFISAKALNALPLTVPPIQEQRAIAEVLGALDDRIEYLSQRRELGYQLQDALFQRLLVEVDDRRPLGEFTTLDKGVSYKGDHVVEDAAASPLINLGNFGRGRAPRWENLKRYDGPTKPRHHVRPGDVVVCATDMTHDRVVLGKALTVPEELEHASVTHHLYALRLADEAPISQRLVALALNHEPIRRTVATYANGTTVLSLPRDAVHRVEVPVPSPDQLAEFDAAADSLQHLIDQAARETSTLRATRDALLPKLLSGELRIDNPSRLVGATG